jgi:hypothetical protein
MSVTIAVAGDGITPKDVSLRHLAELLEATAAAFEAVSAEKGVAVPVLSLAKVKTGSAAYQFYSEDAQAEGVAKSLYTAARKRGRGSSPAVRRSISRMLHASKAGPLRIEPVNDNPKEKPVLIAEPLPDEGTEIDEGTVVYGRIVGVRIDTHDRGKVSLRYDDGGQGEFNSPPELVGSCATLLGRNVSARVTFVRGNERDWDGDLEEVVERSNATDLLTALEDARRELTEKGIVIDASQWILDEDRE